MGVFAIVYPFERDRGIFSKADAMTIDTIEVTDEFRTDPVDAAGVYAGVHEDDAVDVAIVFRQDEFAEGVIEKGRKALERHSSGGSPAAHDAQVLTAVHDSIDPERNDREFTVRWV